MSRLTDQANEAYLKISNEWGAFRRWLALHPLTGAWSAFGLGVIIGKAWGFFRWPFF